MIENGVFVDFLYNKLPSIYREEDEKIGFPLYRYLQCMCDGGFEKSIEDCNNFLKLISPEDCPEEFFPFLYESFGIKYNPEIPIEYHRRFLSNIGELIRRRGTKSAIRFLVSTLTGLEVKIYYNRDENGRFLDIKFRVHTLKDIEKLPVSVQVIEQFIGFQIPFYITPFVTAIGGTEVSGYDYNAVAVRSHSFTTISPYG